MIATLCDIHGNLAALEAVLAEVPEQATIVVGGDIVSGGDQPLETLRRLQQLGERVHWLRGNCDRALMMPGNEGEAFAAPEAAEHVRARLDAEQIAFLHDLPTTVQLGDVLYCHASPRNDLDCFTERTPEDRIAFLFEALDADVIVCGHTHLQFDRTVAGKRVVNAGSVGASAEEQPGACWLLDLVPRTTYYQGARPPEQSREEWLALLETLPIAI